MRPTDELKAEHRAIERMLNVLERACDRLAAGEAVDPNHLEQMLDFFSGFADQCHHAKEETLLFPEMAAAGIPADGPVAPFLEEHSEGRGYVKRMRAALGRYQPGDRAVSSTIVENARDYIALLRQHIEREDAMLFPIADTHLSEAQQTRLAQQFAAVERERIGADQHEGFHRVLDRLEQFYASET